MQTVTSCPVDDAQLAVAFDWRSLPTDGTSLITLKRQHVVRMLKMLKITEMIRQKETVIRPSFLVLSQRAKCEVE
jgi:hypothetical protein